MLYLIFPFGKNYGWGLFGKHLAKEFTRLGQVKLISQHLDLPSSANALDYQFLLSLRASEQEVQLVEQHNDEYPVLQLIHNHQLEPYAMRANAPYKIGYTAFEVLVSQASIEKARAYFDVVATTSSWCTEALQEQGFKQTITVVQGVDPAIFNPSLADKEVFPDRFIIFSGGKFEFRKGQDIVIRAYKVLQDKYPDVMLVNAWHNLWDFSIDTMRASPYIQFHMGGSGDYVTNMNQLLHDNGIQLDRVVTLPLMDHEALASIYRNTDIGIFPNRCEGGTNGVMMGYMACGKPVIASYSSGHKDIVREDNALLIKTVRPFNVLSHNERVAVWDAPDLDETIHHLEWAYHHREAIRDLGRRAGAFLRTFTWKRTAEQFSRLLTQQERI